MPGTPVLGTLTSTLIACYNPFNHRFRKNPKNPPFGALPRTQPPYFIPGNPPLVKIACLIHSLGGGGAERVMAGLSSRLASRGHDVTLICLGDGTDDRHQVDESVQRVSLDGMSVSRGKLSAAWNLYRRVLAIRSATKAIAPDVLLSFCDRTNVLAGLAADGTTRTLLSERSDPACQILPPIWQRLRKHAYRRSDLIITQTETAANFFTDYGVPTTVIPSAVDPPAVTRDPTTAIENHRVIGIGRFAEEKGWDRLLDAFAIVHEKHPQWSLRLLGDGPLRERLQSQIDALQLTDHVDLPGWVHPVGSELSAASLFVLPSHYEGFPSALLEAMACGVPSIALETQSGSRAIIEHEKNGLLVQADVSSLAQAMDSLITDSALRQQLATAGPAVIQRFSWQSMVDEYERILFNAPL